MNGVRSRFSVVIPHLNEHENLRRCLSAIAAAASDQFDVEVVVADNGSAMPPTWITDEFPSAILVVETRKGPGPARNAGAALAHGDLLCFLDCDCFVEPDYFDQCAAFFAGYPDIAFVGGSIGIWPSRPPHLNPYEAYEAVFSYRAALFVRRDRFAATGNMVVRRTVFDLVGPFADINHHEDKLWGHKAVGMGLRIDYVSAIRVLTPGCTNFPEIARRIERHVAHDFGELRPGLRSRLRWIMTAVLVLISPPIGIGEIMRCPQIDSAKLHLQTFMCLCRIRAYRAWLMLDALRGHSGQDYLGTWNRPEVKRSLEEVK